MNVAIQHVDDIIVLCSGDTFPFDLIVGLNVGVVVIIIIVAVIVVDLILRRMRSRLYRFYIKLFLS